MKKKLQNEQKEKKQIEKKEQKKQIENNEQKKKKEPSTHSIIKHLYTLEEEDKLYEIESQNYAQDILVNKKKSLIIHLAHSIFKEGETSATITESLHVIKLCFILDPKNTNSRLEQVIKKEDFANKLLLLILNLSKEDLGKYEDIFFLLHQMFSNINFDNINVEIINKLFDALDRINDEINFTSLFYILMNINNIKQKELFSVRNKHENYRLVDEYAIKELNKTKNVNDILKILFYIYVMLTDKNKYILYRNDFEILIDELLYLLDYAENKDVQIFVINIILESISNELYKKNLYKIDEIENLFNNIIDSDESDNIKDLCKRGIDIISKNN